MSCVIHVLYIVFLFMTVWCHQPGQKHIYVYMHTQKYIHTRTYSQNHTHTYSRYKNTVFFFSLSPSQTLSYAFSINSSFTKHFQELPSLETSDRLLRRYHLDVGDLAINCTTANQGSEPLLPPSLRQARSLIYRQQKVEQAKNAAKRWVYCQC